VGLQRNFPFLYAVTNKHVIENSLVLRLNARDGKTTVIETLQANWVSHPDGDDLAACFIYFDPREIKFKYVNRGNFLTKDIVKQFNIGPGDDAFMVGRFVNHEGKQSNLPTVRFGNVAQMPLERIDGQEGFLIEVRSIGGYSGSPIFVCIPVASERPDVKDWGKPANILSSHGPWLLGVDRAYMNNWTPVCRGNGIPVNPSNPAEMQVAANTGMAVAVPAWKLAELLDYAPLAEHRKEMERQIMEYENNNPPIVTPNS
jgi:hypothetical protein